MIDFLIQGGRTMIPLCICSLVSLTIIIERFISLRKQNVLPTALGASLSKEEMPERVVEKAQVSASSLSRIVQALYAKRNTDGVHLMHIFQGVFKKEIVMLEAGLTALEVITTITPLLGLLGTVLGMVDVFNVVAQVGAGQASALSSGISKALITTIIGLSIAIPTLVFHSYFSRRVEKYCLALEEYGQIMVNMLLAAKEKTKR